MQGKPISEVIDDLLAIPKEIGGEPDWQPLQYDEMRLVMPLTTNGVSTGAELQIAAFPLTGHKKYRILLCAPSCVWRIDHVFDEPHVNSFDKPGDLLEFSFCEPHYHSWSDNRRFCTHASLPTKLHNARILPAWSFDSTLRWFCSETNIQSPPSGLITLPQRTRLV